MPRTRKSNLNDKDTSPYFNPTKLSRARQCKNVDSSEIEVNGNNNSPSKKLRKDIDCTDCEVDLGLGPRAARWTDLHLRRTRHSLKLKEKPSNKDEKCTIQHIDDKVIETQESIQSVKRTSQRYKKPTDCHVLVEKWSHIQKNNWQVNEKHANKGAKENQIKDKHVEESQTSTEAAKGSNSFEPGYEKVSEGKRYIRKNRNKFLQTSTMKEKALKTTPTSTGVAKEGNSFEPSSEKVSEEKRYVRKNRNKSLRVISTIKEKALKSTPTSTGLAKESNSFEPSSEKVSEEKRYVRKNRNKSPQMTTMKENKLAAFGGNSFESSFEKISEEKRYIRKNRNKSLQTSTMKEKALKTTKPLPSLIQTKSTSTTTLDEIDSDFETSEYFPTKRPKRTNNKQEPRKSSKNKISTDKSNNLSEQQRLVVADMAKCDNDVNDDNDGESDDSESEWEDVEDAPGHSPVKSQVPHKGVEILLDDPNIFNKRKKKKFDIQVYFKRMWNKWKKDLREDTHKVNLLMLLAHGQYLNSVCNDPTLTCQALSVIPSQVLVQPYSTYTVDTLRLVLKWYKSIVSLDIQVDETSAKDELHDTLQVALSGKQARGHFQYVLMFVVFLRALGADVRLVFNLTPFPLKETSNSWTKKSSKGKNITNKSSQVKSPGTSTDSKKQKTPNTKKMLSPKTKNQAPRKCASKVKYEDDMQGDTGSDDDFQPGGKLKLRNISVASSNNVSDCEENGQEAKITSEQGESSSNEEKKSDMYYWIEVYIEKENRWICVDCIRNKVDQPMDIETAISSPINYVLAIKSDGGIKDVTRRYASNWLGETRKLRVGDDWWNATLKPYKSADVAQEECEDKQLQDQLLKQPLPTSVSEFKSHPLYALRRHLLKFEAIYPESAVPLGYIKGEPVYARECIHTLHSRENWLKEARSVRIGEKPYKFAKSRKNWKKPTIKERDELTLELFGKWQTEEYMPLPAVDGKVPRNEYGNVELYQPSMLPPGTVHLQIDGLGKVAKKLNIDFASAMVGWEVHGGWSHPQLEGIVVCEEVKDILLAAWDEEQEIQKERENLKRQKRALGNWRFMVKGLIIGERLKTRFNLHEPKVVSDIKGKARDVDLSWPQNRKDSSSKEMTFAMEEL